MTGKQRRSRARHADLEIVGTRKDGTAPRWPLSRWFGDKGYWNGRDLRGHFAKYEDVDEPCPHKCCSHKKPGDRPVVHVRHTAPRKKETAADRKKRRQMDDRQNYDGYLDSHYRSAEEATNGYMVNRAGAARGYSGGDFFKPGRRPSVEKWGSDELRAWFGSGNVAAGNRRGRGSVLSFTEWKNQQTERRAA